MRPMVSIFWQRRGGQAKAIAIGRSAAGLARQLRIKAKEVGDDPWAEEPISGTDQWNALLAKGSTFSLIHYLPGHDPETVQGAKFVNPESAKALAKSAMDDFRAQRRLLKATRPGKSAKNSRLRPHPMRTRARALGRICAA